MLLYKNINIIDNRYKYYMKSCILKSINWLLYFCKIA